MAIKPDISLMNLVSQKRLATEAKNMYPISVSGFMRTWGLLDKKHRIACFTVTKKKKIFFNRVYYLVNVEQVAITDRRELSYCRLKVNRCQLYLKETTGCIFFLSLLSTYRRVMYR